MSLKFETKANAILEEVKHDSQKADKGGLKGSAKAEYKPNFRLAGKGLTFTLEATERSILHGVGKLADVSAKAKVEVTKGISFTPKYAFDKKRLNASLKADTKVGGKLWKNEMKNISKEGPVVIESELYINPTNKAQVETIGKEFDSVKFTHIRGFNEFKLKYIIRTKEPVLGLDTKNGKQKWDFEYNLGSGRVDARVKVYPISLKLASKVHSKGLDPITYTITTERQFFV